MGPYLDQKLTNKGSEKIQNYYISPLFIMHSNLTSFFHFNHNNFYFQEKQLFLWDIASGHYIDNIKIEIEVCQFSFICNFIWRNVFVIFDALCGTLFLIPFIGVAIFFDQNFLFFYPIIFLLISQFALSLLHQAISLDLPIMDHTHAHTYIGGKGCHPLLTSREPRSIVAVAQAEIFFIMKAPKP